MIIFFVEDGLFGGVVKKVIAFDLVSLFHMYSALACVDALDDVSVAEFNMIPDINGCYSIKEGQFVFDRCNVNFINQKFLCRHWKCVQYFLMVIKFCLFVLGRVLRLKTKIVVLHHSYFKPTILCKVSFSDSLRLDCMCFEEGVGTYGNLKDWVRSSRREGKKYPLVTYYLKKAFSFFCHKKFNVLNMPSKEEAFSFRKAVSSISVWQFSGDAISLLKIKNELGCKNISIFFSSPFVDIYGANEVDYKNFLLKLINQNKDSVFLVKPHPLEVKSISVYKNLGIGVIPKHISGEMVVSLVSPKIVFGCYSGVLLSAAHVYSIASQNIGANFSLKGCSGEGVSVEVKKLFANIE